MAKLTFIGVGSAFTTADYYQSNALIEADSGKKLLLDCGADARFALAERGITNENVGQEIDAVYISHLHADHVGGMEWLGFCTYFHPHWKPPTLFAAGRLIDDMWSHSLSGGMRSYEGKVLSIDDYFDCRPVRSNHSFEWEGLVFTPVQTVHVMNGFELVESFGLLIQESGRDAVNFMTTDTQFCPTQLGKFYSISTRIFHDCETAEFRSGVHAHYDELRSLDEDVRRKMWLYHYQPRPEQQPDRDGFLGFVHKGQTFDLSAPADQTSEFALTDGLARQT